MKKPASLRKAITRWLKSLERDPDKLNLWIDEGRVLSWPSNLNFEYRYQLNVSVEDFTDEPSVLMVVIVEWLKNNQPDLLADKDKKGFRFVVDIIDNETTDISIELDLSERVIVNPNQDGHVLEHQDEPNPIFADDEPCTDPPVLLKTIYHGDDKFVPHDNG